MASMSHRNVVALLTFLVAAVYVGAESHDILECHGSGTTNPSKLFWKVLSLMEERIALPVKLTYRAVGSGVGQTEFVNNGTEPLNDFGSGDIPLTQANWEILNGVGMVHVPFMLGAISFFHSVDAAPNLNLTACLLSGIFQRIITRWDDPDILAVNPSLKVPAGQNITVVHRGLGSSSTSVMSLYLSRACISSRFNWTIGVGSGGLGPNDLPRWPSDTVVAEGSGGVSDYIDQHPYTIGYVEAGHGLTLGLNEVALRNRDGVFLTSSQADIAAAASGEFPAADANWAAVDVVDREGANVWPMTAFTFLYIRKNLTSKGEAGPLTKAFARFLLSPEGQAMTTQYGFEPAPPEIVTLALAGVNALELDTTIPEWQIEVLGVTPLAALPGARIISDKRRSYANMALDEIHAQLGTVHLPDLQERVVKLEEEQTSDNVFHDVLECHGSGTTNPSKLFWKVLSLLEERMALPVKLTYRAVGSGVGQTEFVNGGQEPLNDFGSGDIPLTQRNWDVLNGTGMVHVPFMLGAISFFHSVEDAPDLNLTACLLSRIFQRDITQWDHPDILAVNPSLIVPAGQPIKVVHRGLGSSSTSVMSLYLSRACSTFNWTIGVGSGGLGPNDLPRWPNDTYTAEGSAGVSDFINEHTYTIGYVEAGHGLTLGLNEVALRNRAGVFLKSSQADIAAAASGEFPAADANWAAVDVVDREGANVWPMTAFTFLYIRKDLRSKGEGGPLTKAFARFLLSPEGQAMTTQYGFAPAPPSILAIASAGLDMLQLDPSLPEWQIEVLGVTPLAALPGARIISDKRRSYANLALDEVHAQLGTVHVPDLQERVVKLEEEQTSDNVFHDVLECHGSGTTNPSKLFWKVLSLLEERMALPVKLTYRAVGSGVGQTEFVNRGQEPLNDFGSGDIPLTQRNWDVLNGTGMVHVPFMLGAISFFHSVEDAPDLNLTACLLSRIFQRDITQWDHPDILAVNPSLIVPAGQPIKVVHRGLDSSSTSVMSLYLSRACSTFNWTIGVGSGGLGPNDLPRWPNDTYTAEGSAGVSDFINEHTYTIGYVEAGHGLTLGLNEVALRNRDGVFLKSSQADIAAAASGEFPAADANWAAVDVVDREGANVWPMTAFTFLYIRKDLRSKGEGGPLTKAFARFLLSPEGQAMTTQYGFEPAPPSILAIASAGLDMLQLDPSLPEWQIEVLGVTPLAALPGARIISDKRRSYANLALDEVHAQLGTVHVPDLQARILELETALAALRQQVAALSPNNATTSDDDDDDDDGSGDGETPGMARVNAALALAIIGTALSLLLLMAMLAANRSVHREMRHMNHAFAAAVTPSIHSAHSFRVAGNGMHV
eukprot:jgi/Mesvir1/12664/Mv02212-RA.2